MNRSILRLAVPALGALAIDPLLTLVDTAFIARVGTVELAALGVDTALLGIAFFAFNFLAYATTPLVAQALGRGDRERARRWVGDALVLAITIGAVTTAVLVVIAPTAVRLMGAEAPVAGPAIDYLRLRALATPAVLIVTAGHGAFRGHQDTRTPLRVAAVVNAINIALDPLLIFAAGLGLVGAAVATIAAQWIGAFWFLRLLARRGMASWPAGLRQSFPTLIELARSGILISLRTAMILVAFTYAAAKATALGTAEIAAHQVVMQVWLLAVMFADAFAIAAQALVGEAVGSRDVSRVDRLSVRLVWWGVLIGIVLALGFLGGGSLLRFIVEDAAVSELARSASVVGGLMMFYAGALFVADGIFLGLFALRKIIASTASGAIAAVALMAMTGLGDSLDGIWWALSAMMVARAIVFVFSYRPAVSAAVRS